MLFVLAGPSYVGKKTSMAHFIKLYSFNSIIPYTTKPHERRKGEVEGIQYHYISEDSKEDIVNEDFIYDTPFKYEGNNDDVIYAYRKIDITNAIDSYSNFIIHASVHNAIKIYDEYHNIPEYKGQLYVIFLDYSASPSTDEFDRIFKLKYPDQINGDNDENFLWAITPAHKKDQFARFIVTDNSIIATSSPRHSWDKVIEMIQKRILTERPETLTKEFQEIEPRLKDSAHIQKLKNLKGLLYKKQNHMNNLEDRKDDLAMAHYDTISKIEIKLINTMPVDNKSFKQIKTFLRELYHRAIEKQPELKQIYKKNYKKYYNNHQNETIKIGRLKQEASAFGHSCVKDYLKYGSTDSNNIPF